MYYCDIFSHIVYIFTIYSNDISICISCIFLLYKPLSIYIFSYILSMYLLYVSTRSTDISNLPYRCCRCRATGPHRTRPLRYPRCPGRRRSAAATPGAANCRAWRRWKRRWDLWKPWAFSSKMGERWWNFTSFYHGISGLQWIDLGDLSHGSEINK